MRHLRPLWFILTIVPLIAGLPALAGAKSAPDPKTSMQWFQRATDRMNLRMPGSIPLHMKVTFHAFPGAEILDAEKSEIVTGDGTYEETWLGPHEWRREVTLSNYHAIEVESARGRKMEASSDYEPNRVLKLLNALLDPIPRNLVSREFGRAGSAGWTIDHLSKGGSSLVRISQSVGDQRGAFTEALYFLPQGLLISRNEYGLATTWEDDVVFGEKIVPRHLTIKAGERELLTANVVVEAASQIDPAAFDLPIGPAEPGNILRPLHYFEVRPPVELSATPLWLGNDNSAVSTLGVIDRTGKYREVEVIVGLNLEDDRNLRQLMNDFRKARWRPAEIDRKSCEFVMPRLFVKKIYQSIGR